MTGIPRQPVQEQHPQQSTGYEARRHSPGEIGNGETDHPDTRQNVTSPWDQDVTSDHDDAEDVRIQHHQHLKPLSEREQEEFAGNEQDGVIHRDLRFANLGNIIQTEHEVRSSDRQLHGHPVSHVVPHSVPSACTSALHTSYPVPREQVPHYYNNGGHEETPPCTRITCDSSRHNRIEMTMLSVPPPDSEECDPPEVVDELIVPILPLPVAIVCCVMNFAVPGLGTVMAGLCVLCCGDGHHTEAMPRPRKLCSCGAVVGVGFLQLLLTACFLIGWVWSAIWGLSLVGTSMDYYEKPQEVSSWRSGGRRAGAHSGISNTSCFSQPLGRGRRRPRSNFIYPMRAPSDIDRDSPPPPYVMFPTPPPAYSPPTPGNALTTREMPPEPPDLPEMTETPSVPTERCAVCQRDYESGEQRFVCRRCTDIVCRRCYAKRIPFQGGDSCIVCDVCYQEHAQTEAEMETT